jgi:hypothetical protein
MDKTFTGGETLEIMNDFDAIWAKMYMLIQLIILVVSLANIIKVRID